MGVQAGSQRERVEARLMLLFRRPLEAVRPVADGNGALLKKGLDLDSAVRYRDALARCGCDSVIEEDSVLPVARATLAEYATLLQAQLQALDPGRRWQFIAADSELFGVPGPASPYPLELLVPLERMYQEWLAATPAASEDLLRYTAGMVLMGNTPGMVEEAARHLLPTVRNSAERGQAMLAAARGYSPLLFRPLCEGLEVGLVYQRGSVVHRVAQAHLDAWDMNEEAAFEAAFANLRARSSLPLQSSPQGVFGGLWDDGYDSSRMLLPELFSGLVSHGRPVAMVPTRGLLMVCSDKNDIALEAMLKAAIDAMREEKMLTPRMLRLVDGRWQPFVPAALSRRLNSLAKYAESNDYRLQKELLKARTAASGQDLYVATYMVGKTGPEQRRTSACTWTRGVPSLLPKTDLLCFTDPASGAPPITVSWDEALPVIGALLQRTDDCPPRYLADGFPNALQLAQLAEYAAAARRAAQELARAQAAAHAQEHAPTVILAPARPAWYSLRTVLGRWADAKSAHAR
ncbi:hypothetical protein GTP41_25310 [Pseudoduganella sp. DS3]|uniref:Uncharacterized protein n=1 Tax=Pseudoduganella guangdongensis TaxID=2692179 RepID=A0A6N9HPQ1_9BURK|nr:hypothetical protein [Pseudoduganella guangdongensis]MYN05419.1 hypothetical protein [Pseudoduganella guangdongensis]